MNIRLNEGLRAVLTARLREIEQTAVRPEGVNWEQFMISLLLQNETLGTNTSSPEYNAAIEAMGAKHSELVVEE